MKLYQIALLGVATVAAAQGHGHVHRHPARRGSPVEARNPDAVTETVAGPVYTVYELNGADISYDEVEAGIKAGKYVIVGEKITTVIPATSSVTSTSSTSTPSASQGGQFYQESSSSSSSTTTTPAPATSSSTSSSAPATSSSSSGNIGASFPSGSIPCSTFPSAYGAVYVDYLGLEGWTGIQQTPSFTFGVDTSISEIVTTVAGGGGCTSGSFCSYACPAGYQKSQWPSAQGSAGQSVGGLYCNSAGLLELSRPAVPQICITGTGGVSVTNNLSKNVAVCRTDYPGLESETIPLNTQPGQTYPLTCPDATTYYQWEGSTTSAQYYINPDGASVDDACVWGSSGTNLGNWAPVNVGVGKGTDGVTYLSIFPNTPTNDYGSLDFTIEITGDVSGDCKYSGGTYYNNGVQSSTGCTVAITGSTAAYVFS